MKRERKLSVEGEREMVSVLTMMMGGETWANLGSIAAGVMFVWAMFRQYFPDDLREPIEKFGHKLMGLVYPYVQITFHEYSGDGFERSKVYAAIERYLVKNSLSRAKRLKADVVHGSESLVFSMDDHEEVVDVFQNVKLWWSSNQNVPQRQSISFFPREDEKHYYKLEFHKKNRDLVTATYIKHVLDEGKAIEVKTRQRKLYTNSKGGSEGYSYRRRMWSHVKFEHPSTFDTLAMEATKKQEIIDDLIKFSQSKDYYKRIGKAWKRGYLLYGPPGTGKSSMIAAMANLLEYDVYDLELTAVKDNTELRKLLIDTCSKSIVVIEDIDCSLDLTGQRKKEEKEKEKEATKEDKEKDPAAKMMMKPEEKDSKVTLSGLLNFIDGLWSACGGERIIVFTTNYLEKLDPALIRRGRMDKHIELSYCGFEAFKILAKNYMDIDSHPLFNTIQAKLEEIYMTPADVAENLMPKSDKDNADSCLEGLIKALDKAKEDARLKAEEEDRLKKENKEKEEHERLKKEKEVKDEEKSMVKSAAGEDQVKLDVVHG